MKRQLPCAWFMSPLLLCLIACGGSSSRSSNSNSVSTDVNSISLSCTPSSVTVDGTTHCTATVTGTGNYSSAVAWSASAGTVNASGVFTAPASAGNVTVIATSTQDPVVSGTTSLAVQSSPSSITSVPVACNPTTVNANATAQCNATVNGTGNFNPAVTWSASAGTIASSGLFTAPAAAGPVTITATSVQDTTQAGNATVTVQSQTPPPPQSKHIVMVVEENASYASAVRNSNWPNLNNLISNGALATDYYADSHPSIGNYFMLTTGQLLTTNDYSTKVWNADNIARRMLAANVSFRIYAEGISRGYVGGDTGAYLVRHNPFARFSDIANNPTVANQAIWPFAQFATDLANGTLPAFSFIVPDVNDDAHDGTPQQADSWLETNLVTRLSNDPAFQAGGDGLLIVTFDEGAFSDITHGGGHVAAVFWGPMAAAGYTQASSTLYQHQSILRTVMDTLGLPNPPAAAATAPSMSEFLK